MNSLADTELLRARWRRTLERHALDNTTRDDFALGGLASRLRTPTVQLLLLPSDPELETIHIDDALWAWCDANKTVDIDGRQIRFGDQKCPTAHAAALVGGYGREPWSSYLAVHRSGAIEFGLGDRGGWERDDQAGNTVREFNLISIVSCSWAMLKLSATLHERTELPPPLHLTIALRGTKNAVLGNVGQGWAEPRSRENSVGGCLEDNLLWHLTLDDVRDGDTQQHLAFSIGDRLEDAWGMDVRRYLARSGDRTGLLDHGRIVE